jgi:uncharacterized delta-60 repeat protein
MKKRYLFSAVLVAAALRLPAQNAGDLDESFGNNGIVITDVTGGNDFSYAAVIQPNGHVVLTGYSSFTHDIFLCRYDTLGYLDPTFGSGGIVSTDAGTESDYASAMALQPDGKLVVGGTINDGGSNTEAVILRYLSDGTMDTAFGNSGSVVLGIGAMHEIVRAVMVQADGKILVAGATQITGTVYDWVIARVNANGSMDDGFGEGGIRVIDFGMSDFASALTQTNDKIVITGYTGSGGSYDFVTARLNNDGTFDESFGSGGWVITSVNTSTDWAEHVCMQNDSKLVVAGLSWDPVEENYDAALVRYLADGSADPSFGNNGIVTTSFSTENDEAFSAAIQPDGKILIGGVAQATVSAGSFLLARYTENGQPDAAFGDNGSVIISYAGNDAAWEVMIAPNNKIMLAGYSSDGLNADAALLRFHNDLEVGVYNPVSSEFFRVFPNPVVANEVRLTFPFRSAEVFHVALFTWDGRRMLSFADVVAPADNGCLTLALPAELPSGLYLLKVESEQLTGTVPLAIVR